MNAVGTTVYPFLYMVSFGDNIAGQCDFKHTDKVSVPFTLRNLIKCLIYIKGFKSLHCESVVDVHHITHAIIK